MSEHLKRSRRQEKRGESVYSGKRNAGSGNQHRKNDVRRDGYDVEFKSTSKQSYSLKLADLIEGSRHAVLEHRELIFGIDFAPSTGIHAGTIHRYVVCEEYTMLDLLRIRDEYELDRAYWDGA